MKKILLIALLSAAVFGCHKEPTTVPITPHKVYHRLVHFDKDHDSTVSKITTTTVR